MRRRVAGRVCKLFLLLSALAVHSSCSYSAAFVVVNKSGAPLEVQYKLKEGRPGGEPYTLEEKPAKKPAKDLEDSDAAWRELAAEEFAFDARAGLVTVTVEPGEVLRVYDSVNYSQESDVDAEFFPVAGLRLSGQRGTVQYVGEQARLQFREESMSLYTVTYY